MKDWMFDMPEYALYGLFGVLLLALLPILLPFALIGWIIRRPMGSLLFSKDGGW